MFDDRRAEWSVTSRTELGQALFEAVPPLERPRWAGTVLGAATARFAAAIPEVEAVYEIAMDDRRWLEARSAFDAVRQLVLSYEQAPTGDQLYRRLLDLAETVAKITYNAAGPIAPYDYHAGWRLAPRARVIADLVGDPALEDRLWMLLTGRRPEPAA